MTSAREASQEIRTTEGLAGSLVAAAGGSVVGASVDSMGVAG
jgi:hypothetical protein